MKRTDVIDYALPEDAHSIMHGSVSKGTEVPVIVVAVDEEAGTFSGTAFLPNGQTEWIGSAPIPEAEPEPVPEPVPVPDVKPDAEAASYAAPASPQEGNQ